MLATRGRTVSSVDGWIGLWSGHPQKSPRTMYVHWAMRAGAPCCYSVCTQLVARVAQAAPRSAAALERYWLASSRARGPRDAKANDDRPRRTRRSRERLLGSRSPTTVVCPGYKAAYTYIKRFNGVIDESFYKRSMLCHVAEPVQSEARSSSSVRSETQ